MIKAAPHGGLWSHEPWSGKFKCLLWLSLTMKATVNIWISRFMVHETIDHRVVPPYWLVQTIQWFLLLTWCHFQPLVTFGHSLLEMAPRERQKPFHFINTSVDKQILISSRHFKANPLCNPNPGFFRLWLWGTKVTFLIVDFKSFGTAPIDRNTPLYWRECHQHFFEKPTLIGLWSFDIFVG